MKKLIYITNARIPTEKAHGYQICKMCEEFSNVGQEVELVVPKRNNNIKDDLFSYYSLKNNFKVRYISSFDFFKWEKILGKYSFYLQSLFFLLNIFISKFQKDAILYTRSPEIAWVCSYKGKTIYEAHSWPESKIGLLNFFLKKVYKIVVISNGLKDEFINNGYKEENILVAPDGVDIEKFDISISKEEARKKLNLPQDKKIAMYTGHLYKWKGVQTLADAAKLLPDDYIIYFVGGTKRDREKFIIKNKELIDKGKIVSVLHQPHNQIPTWLKTADILVLPNSGKEKISSKYTSPLKLFEYMVSKRLMVASSLPSFKEILGNNCCIFFTADDSIDLANKIKTAANSSLNFDNVVGSAYLKTKEYTWKKRANRIINFIY